MSWNDLARAVRGPVLTAVDDGYAAEVAGFNTAASTTPDVVVGATSADDIVEAVRFARALRAGHRTGRRRSSVGFPSHPSPQ